MSQLSVSTVIGAPQDLVFQAITHPQTVATLIPGVVDVDNYLLPLRRGATFRWEFVFLGMRLRGVWTVDELTPPTVYIAETDGGMTSRWAYTLTKSGRRTRLKLTVDFEPPVTLLKSFAIGLIDTHVQRIAETYLASLKEFVELQKAQLKG